MPKPSNISFMLESFFDNGQGVPWSNYTFFKYVSQEKTFLGISKIPDPISFFVFRAEIISETPISVKSLMIVALLRLGSFYGPPK